MGSNGGALGGGLPGQTHPMNVANNAAMMQMHSPGIHGLNPNLQRNPLMQQQNAQDSAKNPFPGINGGILGSGQSDGQSNPLGFNNLMLPALGGGSSNQFKQMQGINSSSRTNSSGGIGVQPDFAINLGTSMTLDSSLSGLDSNTRNSSFSLNNQQQND